MNIKQFAIDCYDYTNKQLFEKCLELYEKLSQSESKLHELNLLQYKEELEVLNSITIELEVNDDGLIIDKDFDLNYALKSIQNTVPNVVAILSELPSELGLHDLEVVTVTDVKFVKNYILKFWIMPKTCE